MALINGIYVLCESEDITDDVTLSEHPTESGLPLTDTVRKKPIELSIRGKIVNYENLSTKNIIDKLCALKNQGSLIDFQGTTVLSNLQISSFSYNKNYKIHGGADFSMSLKEHRIAKSSYTPQENNSSNSDTQFEVDSTVVFKGGPVYISSDATEVAATRGKSTCILTKISTLHNALHIYHLISKDCTYGSSNYVYGWVDAENVSAVGDTSTSSSNNAGKQSIDKSELLKGLYHTVKPGDTVWSLVNEKYRNVNTTVTSVIRNNPSCFSTHRDATTLKVGSRLYIGDR